MICKITFVPGTRGWEEVLRASPVFARRREGTVVWISSCFSVGCLSAADTFRKRVRSDHSHTWRPCNSQASLFKNWKIAYWVILSDLDTRILVQKFTLILLGIILRWEQCPYMLSQTFFTRVQYVLALYKCQSWATEGSANSEHWKVPGQ